MFIDMERNGTGSVSCSTLVYGMDLAALSLNELLDVKAEPQDEEEREMQKEIQAGP